MNHLIPLGPNQVHSRDQTLKHIDRGNVRDLTEPIEVDGQYEITTTNLVSKGQGKKVMKEHT